ncbi:MAG: NUDIX domain-containing protein [Dehalococcoidia bacterium]
MVAASHDATHDRIHYVTGPGPAVVVVIFTVREGALHALLVHRAADPCQDMWALPGGLLLPEETLDAAASRVLVRETGVAELFLEQLYTFDAAPAARAASSVTVSYFALVAAERARLEPRETWRPAWRRIDALPELAFQNNAIIDYALLRLRAKLDYTNVVCNLMPEEFSLTELQRVYETILGRPLDKRNFRRRMVSLDLVRPTARRAAGGAHRPAQLYRFASRRPMVF